MIKEKWLAHFPKQTFKELDRDGYYYSTKDKFRIWCDGDTWLYLEVIN